MIFWNENLDWVFDRATGWGVTDDERYARYVGRCGPVTLRQNLQFPAQASGEFRLGGKISAEFTHHLRVGFTCQLLPNGPVVLLDKVGEGRGRPRLGGRQ